MSEKKSRLIIVGGFLGAGKTTAIAALAKRYVQQGFSVGVVTNDQAGALVDTAYLKALGLRVTEVSGGCFCCHFDDFIAQLDRLSQQEGAFEAPDILLAEPVGSCTDLVATLCKPLFYSHTLRFNLSPLTVLCDPRRVKRLMSDDAPFPGELNYLFQKQIEEADLLLLNKVDTLSPEETEGLLAFLASKVPGARVQALSALEGDGLALWQSELMEGAFVPKPSLDIDYLRYGKAEAQLGWLNATVCVHSQDGGKLAWPEFLMALLSRMGEEMAEGKHEIAHLKAYAITDTGSIKLSLVSFEEPPQPSAPLDEPTLVSREATLVLNARIHMDPAPLRIAVYAALEQCAARYAVELSGFRADSFAPGQPKPSYRMA